MMNTALICVIVLSIVSAGQSSQQKPQVKFKRDIYNEFKKVDNDDDLWNLFVKSPTNETDTAKKSSENYDYSDLYDNLPVDDLSTEIPLEFTDETPSSSDLANNTATFSPTSDIGTSDESPEETTAIFSTDPTTSPGYVSLGELNGTRPSKPHFSESTTSVVTNTDKNTVLTFTVPSTTPSEAIDLTTNTKETENAEVRADKLETTQPTELNSTKQSISANEEPSVAIDNAKSSANATAADDFKTQFTTILNENATKHFKPTTPLTPNESSTIQTISASSTISEATTLGKIVTLKPNNNNETTEAQNVENEFKSIDKNTINAEITEGITNPKESSPGSTSNSSLTIETSTEFVDVTNPIHMTPKTDLVSQVGGSSTISQLTTKKDPPTKQTLKTLSTSATTTPMMPDSTTSSTKATVTNSSKNLQSPSTTIPKTTTSKIPGDTTTAEPKVISTIEKPAEGNMKPELNYTSENTPETTTLKPNVSAAIKPVENTTKSITSTSNTPIQSTTVKPEMTIASIKPTGTATTEPKMLVTSKSQIEKTSSKPKLTSTSNKPTGKTERKIASTSEKPMENTTTKQKINKTSEKPTEKSTIKPKIFSTLQTPLEKSTTPLKVTSTSENPIEPTPKFNISSTSKNSMEKITTKPKTDTTSEKPMIKTTTKPKTTSSSKKTMEITTTPPKITSEKPMETTSKPKINETSKKPMVKTTTNPKKIDRSSEKPMVKTTEKPRATSSSIKPIIMTTVPSKITSKKPMEATAKPKIPSTSKKPMEKTTTKPKINITSKKPVVKTTAKPETTSSSKKPTETTTTPPKITRSSEKPMGKTTTRPANTSKRPMATTTKPNTSRTSKKPFGLPTVSTKPTSKPSTTVKPRLLTLEPAPPEPTLITNPLLGNKYYLPDEEISFSEDEIYFVGEKPLSKSSAESESSVNKFKSVDNRNDQLEKKRTNHSMPKFVIVNQRVFPICYTFNHSVGLPGHDLCVLPSKNINVLDFMPIDINLWLKNGMKIDNNLLGPAYKTGITSLDKIKPVNHTQQVIDDVYFKKPSAPIDSKINYFPSRNAPEITIEKPNINKSDDKFTPKKYFIDESDIRKPAVLSPPKHESHTSIEENLPRSPKEKNRNFYTPQKHYIDEQLIKGLRGSTEPKLDYNPLERTPSANWNIKTHHPTEHQGAFEPKSLQTGSLPHFVFRETKHEKPHMVFFQKHNLNSPHSAPEPQPLPDPRPFKTSVPVTAPRKEVHIICEKDLNHGMNAPPPNNCYIVEEPRRISGQQLPFSQRPRQQLIYLNQNPLPVPQQKPIDYVPMFHREDVGSENHFRTTNGWLGRQQQKIDSSQSATQYINYNPAEPRMNQNVPFYFNEKVHTHPGIPGRTIRINLTPGKVYSSHPKKEISSVEQVENLCGVDKMGNIVCSHPQNLAPIHKTYMSTNAQKNPASSSNVRVQIQVPNTFSSHQQGTNQNPSNVYGSLVIQGQSMQPGYLNGQIIVDPMYHNNRHLGQLISRSKRSLPVSSEGKSEEEGVSLAIVFDTTGSMNTELALIKESALKIADEMLNNPNIAIEDFIYVPFQDEVIPPPPTKTQDKFEFFDAITSTSIGGGLDCPELCLGGVKKAIELSKPYSFIYVFTDAEPGDYELVPEIITLIQRKHPQIFFLLTGHCRKRGPLAQRRAYSTIASVSSGLVVDLLHKVDVDKVLNYIPGNSKKGKVILKFVNSTAIENPYEVLLKIDPTITEMTITTIGNKVTWILLNPNKTAPSTDQIKELLKLENINVINIQNPEPGDWTVNVTKATSDHSLVTTGLSSSNFLYGFSVIPTNEMKETSKRPQKGAMNTILLKATSPENLQTVLNATIITLDGYKLGTIPVTVIDEKKGLYKCGPFIPPDQLFKLEINGITKEGYPLKRITISAISPQLPEKPYITFENSKTVNAGYPLNVTCSVESFVPIQVHLYHKFSSLASLKKFPQTSDISLAISEVDKSHEGIYVCWAKNIAGAATKELNLIVREQPPTLRMENQITGFKGEVLIIRCDVQSTTPYNVSWFKVLPQSTYSPERKIPVRESDNIYLEEDIIGIKELSPKDEGVYMCIATNKGGENNGKTFVKVIEKPEVNLVKSEIYYKIKDTILLECSVSKGIPKPTLAWRKNNIEIQSSERVEVRNYASFTRLIIKNAIRSDEGIYKCLASNSAGMFSRDAYVLLGEVPAIRAYKNEIQSLVGEELSIHCKATGFPKPNVEWRKQYEKSGIKPAAAKSEGGTLTFKSPRAADSGVYACIAKNAVGESEDSVNILFGSKPEIVEKPSNIELEIDSNGKLQCFFSGTPTPSIKWSRVDGKLLKKSSENSILEITEATLDDGGRYKCLVENTFGKAEAEATVAIVGGTPPLIDKNEELQVVKHLIGDQVELQCLLREGNPKPSTKWQKFGKDISSYFFNGFTASNGSLIISIMTAGHSGNYTCITENAIGKDTKEIILKTFEAPKIDNRSVSNIVAQLGSSTVLQCEVSGDPAPIVNWSRGSQQFNSLMRGFRQENSTFLYFNDIKIEDSGKYICKAENLAGVARKEYTVQVIVPPKISPWPKESFVELGSVFSLRCNATGVPKPDIKWLKDNAPINKPGSIYGYDLWFFVEHLDTGIYSCLAENEAGFDRTETKLIILERPTIHYLPNIIEVIKTQGAYLVCNASGNPTPAVYWQFNGETIAKQIGGNSSTILNIENISEGDVGSYFCVASNKVGTSKRKVELKVLEAPMISTWIEIYEAKPNEKVNLKCKATGNPEPNISWYFNGMPFEEASPSSDGSLQFIVDKNHSGDFICIATNKAGSDSKRLMLIVLESPVFALHLPTTVYTEAGKNVELTCTAYGEPKPNVYWDHYNIFSYNDKMFFSLENSTLKLNNVSSSSEGVYTCKAQNKAGINTYKVKLIVFEPPQTNLKTVNVENNSVNENQELLLICDVEGKPVPKITWLKDGKPLPSRYVAEENNLWLIAAEEDSGNFMCIAENSVGQSNSTLFINVNVLPRFLNPDGQSITQLKYSDVVLVCEARGYPEPEIFWAKGNQRIRNQLITVRDGSSQLHFFNLTENSAGNYTCIASNFLGMAEKMFQLIVHSLPEIMDGSPEQITLYEGADYSLTCVVRGFPAPEVIWRIGSTNMSTNQFGDKYSVLNDNTLIMKNLTRFNSGKFDCIATNIEGSVIKTHTLKILIPETQVDDGVELVEKLDGDSANLYCNGKPGDEIIWLKNGVNLMKKQSRSDVEQHEIKDNGLRLNFDEVYSSMTGNYSCVVVTPSGNKTKKFYLNVLNKPYFLSDYFDPHFSANEGQQININCNVSGNPTPLINWRFSNKDMKDIPLTSKTVPGTFMRGGELIIEKVKLSHSGNYKCFATNKVGVVSRTFSIDVSGPPSLKGKETQDINSPANQMVELKCAITGTPELSYSWTFIPKTRAEIPLDSTSNVHIIPRVHYKDEGIYICRGTNKIGTAKMEFKVNIKGPPVIERNRTTEYSFSEGSTVEIHCVVLNESANVYWKRNGNILYKNSNINFTSIEENGNQRSILRLFNIQKMQEGIFTCVASNFAGSKELSYKINVVVPPKFKGKEHSNIQQQTVIKGSPLTVYCPINEIRNGEIIWMKDSKVISHKNISNYTENTFHISITADSDNGIYQCTVSNLAGTLTSIINVTVLVPPMILRNSSSKIQEVLTGTNVTLNCFSKGNPYPKIVWSKNMRPIIWDYFHNNLSKQQMHITNITEKDGGIYTCKALNSVGESQRSFELIIREPPKLMSDKFHTKSVLKVQVNKNVVIDCPLTGSPDPNITWFKGYKILKEFTLHQQLILTNVTEEDSGIYYCTATNKIGSDSFRFYVSIVVPLHWEDWSSWSSCNKMCDGGEQIRTRKCIGIRDEIFEDDFVDYDDTGCKGDNTEKRNCNSFKCPINGGWSIWSEWGPCSSLCGDGLERRYRKCDNPFPSFGGLDCVGNYEEEAQCNSKPCPINGNWGEWSDWNECSVSCGNGVKMRVRSCNNPPPQFDGLHCQGSNREIVICNQPKCPVEEKWSPWSEWSECSVTCGRGYIMRTRTCLLEKDESITCSGSSTETTKCKKPSCSNKMPRRRLKVPTNRNMRKSTSRIKQ